MHHPNIVEFHRAFTFADSTFVVLGLCENGSMMDMVRKRRFLTEPEVRRYVIQTCGAIKYMHHKNVIHRDLKMGNIFLDRHMNVKIGDFGLAALLVSDKEYSANRRRTLCGTPNYIAPEVLEKGQKGHDYKVDIWSLGIIIFAMLTGFPPFQSKTQEEIYRKVKAREYLWPSPEKCPNDISHHAEDLVASLLVQAEDRPEPDDIASHAFFREGHVPLCISPQARTAQPSFSTWSPGLAESEGAWWHSQWTALCRQCGVGNMSRTHNFPLVGEELHKTTYQECQLEERAGRTPFVPIPADHVYRPFPDSKTWPVIRRGPADRDLLQMAREKQSLRGVPANVSYNDVHEAYAAQAKMLPKSASASAIIKKVAAEADDVMRQSTSKSHAAQLRERSHGIKAQRSNDIAWPQPPSDKPARQAEQSEAAKSSQTIKGAPVRAMKDPLQRSVSASTVTGRVTRSQSVQGGLGRDAQTLRGTAPRRNGMMKSASSKAALRPPLPPTEEEKPRAEPKIRARAHARGNEIVAEQVAELGDALQDMKLGGDGKKTRRGRVVSGPRGNPLATQAPAPAPAPAPGAVPAASMTPATIPAPAPAPSVSSKQLRPRTGLIAPDEPTALVPGTAPEVVDHQLAVSLRNLDVALDGRSRVELERRSKPHPIVIKWVDYTNKFGIGYILSDGSVGCLFNAEGEQPCTCIVVRDSESHVKRRDLKTYAERHQLVPQNGQLIEFFENRGTEGVRLAFVEPERYQVKVGRDGAAEQLFPGTDEYDNRKRKTVVLWRKFANYMTDALGKGDDDSIRESRARTERTKTGCGPFVRFYQRFADVGVWGFGHGGFQFNFPDHTKLVLGPDASHADFYHLPAEAARQIQSDGTLPEGALEKRSVLSFPTASLLSGRHSSSGDDFAEIVSANVLDAKLRFVRGVLAQWRANGGLGRMDPSGQRVEWHGARERRAPRPGARSKTEKLVWVTVGAVGGDERVTETRA